MFCSFCCWRCASFAACEKKGAVCHGRSLCESECCGDEMKLSLLGSFEKGRLWIKGFFLFLVV